MTAARKARLSKQNDSRPRFLLPQPRSDKPQLTVLTAKNAKPKVTAPRLAKTKRKDAHQKDHLYKKDNTPRLPKTNSLRTSARKTKQRHTSKRSFIQKRQHTKTAKNAKPKSPHLGWQKQNKDGHQKDHLYKQDNTPRPPKNAKPKVTATRLAKNKTKTHTKKIIYTNKTTRQDRQKRKTKSLRTSARKTAKQKGLTSKKHLYKKITHQDRKIKISAPRLAKTKRKNAHQKDHLYKKDNTPRPRLNDSERAKIMEKSNRRLTRL